MLSEAERKERGQSDVDDMVVEAYIGKLNKLLESCLRMGRIYDNDIKPRCQEDARFEAGWKDGACNGALLYFLMTQTEEEKEISARVFDEAMGDIGGDELIRVMDYVNAALKLLGGLGYDVPEIGEAAREEEK